jgi:UDP-N-acetylglucosamine--dolichyl-phosphate N-acetylglucosaminephosphotransferase
MIAPILLASIISFFTVYFVAPSMKKFLERIDIIGTDQQKAGKPKMATSAGMLVIMGIVLGGFFFIGVNSFILHYDINLEELLAAYCSILIMVMIGFMDDINIRRKPRSVKGIDDHRIGLKQWQKPLLTLPAAIPLMAVSAGVTEMFLPGIGSVDFGAIYPLIFIPLAVVVVSNATNMLAGSNGLEAGMGFVSMMALGFYSFSLGRYEASVIAFTTVFALLAFLRWNWFPANFLPGDSLTYLIGAAFVSIVIIGNIEMFGMFVFIPWIIEFFLKLRSGFRARSLGDLQKDGSLKAPYQKIHSLNHFIMKSGNINERQLTSILILFEIGIVLLAFVLFL